MLDSAVRECDEYVAPGTASVIPPRKGYARLTRIEFETIYSAADAA